MSDKEAEDYYKNHEYHDRKPVYIAEDKLRPDQLERLVKSKTFCMIPWIHVHAFPNGKAFPCCLADSDHPIGDLHKNTIREVWNDTAYKTMRKNFQAVIRIGGKLTGLGTYETAKEAAVAYDRAVLKANKSKTLLNFPDMVHNRTRKLSSTGYRGVGKSGKKFKAVIQLGRGKEKTYLGTFATTIQAALAYDATIKPQSKQVIKNQH